MSNTKHFLQGFGGFKISTVSYKEISSEKESGDEKDDENVY
jgi:hypothetical protein